MIGMIFSVGLSRVAYMGNMVLRMPCPYIICNSVRCRDGYCAEEDGEQAREMHRERRARVWKIFVLEVKVEVAPAARRIADDGGVLVAVKMLRKIRCVNWRNQNRGERVVERRLPTLVPSFPAAMFEFLHRQRAMVGNIFDIAKVIVFVGTLEERNDERVKERERTEGKKQESERAMRAEIIDQ